MIPGELVNLRAIERHDAPVIHRWFNDPTVMRGWGYGAAISSLQSAAQRVEDWLAQEANAGRPVALIAESLAADPIGLVILTLERAEARAVELSLLVGDPEHWGQGLGADMVSTILEACFDGWGIHRVGVRVEAHNERALSLYRGFGFQPEGCLRQAAFRDGQHADVFLFGLLASKWRNKGD